MFRKDLKEAREPNTGISERRHERQRAQHMQRPCGRSRLGLIKELTEASALRRGEWKVVTRR